MGRERERRGLSRKIICSRHYGKTVLWSSPRGDAARELLGGRLSQNDVQLCGITSGEHGALNSGQLHSSPLSRIWEKRAKPSLGQLSFATGFAGWSCMLLSWAQGRKSMRAIWMSWSLLPKGMVAAALGSKGCSSEEASFP